MLAEKKIDTPDLANNRYVVGYENLSDLSASQSSRTIYVGLRLAEVLGIRL
jgi:hypothetical protein